MVGPVRSGATRVAVIDDEPAMARALANLLRTAGLDVVMFLDPTAALAAIMETPFDVVLSDIDMPHLSGIDVLRTVRARHPDLPVLLLTGHPTVMTAQEAVALGAYRYLTKPPDPDELQALVNQAAYAYRMAGIKRRALEVLGGDSEAPGDLLGLSLALDDALERLQVAFQPIVEAATGRLHAYEALLRSGSERLPSPPAVLQAADRLGRVHEVGRRVRALAADAFASAPPGVRLFVNLHPSDLIDPDLVDPRSPLMALAERVVVEVTERASLDGVVDLTRTLATLRARGFQVAVDDLGAGYAGLTSFALLEPEVVKLDMSLVRGIDESEIRQSLVRSVVELTRGLEVKVVAEGIETQAEARTCALLGVDLLQGFYFARPGPPFPSVDRTPD